LTTTAPPLAPPTAEEIARAKEIVGRVSTAFSSRVVGQERLRTALLIALLSEGHVLLESVPGLAKTLAASTLSQTVKAHFSRIQCTPDLLPSDIIGTQVYDQRNHEFETQLGPVHANFVLLDEINRSSAKTQSAMLEAMQERQTSIAGPLCRLTMLMAPATLWSSSTTVLVAVTVQSESKDSSAVPECSSGSPGLWGSPGMLRGLVPSAGASVRLNLHGRVQSFRRSAITAGRVVNLLIGRVGLTRQDLIGMTREEAIARLNQYWSTGR
jgi:hypothetical protein